MHSNTKATNAVTELQDINERSSIEASSRESLHSLSLITPKARRYQQRICYALHTNWLYVIYAIATIKALFALKTIKIVQDSDPSEWQTTRRPWQETAVAQPELQAEDSRVPVSQTHVLQAEFHQKPMSTLL